MAINLHYKLHRTIQDAGYTDKEIAKAIYISPQAMSDKMTGKSQFTSAEIASIGNILNLSPKQYYSCFVKPYIENSMFCKENSHAVHANVVPALLQNELTKSFRWFCYAPTDARVITDFQVTGFGCGFEFSVVILPAPAAILYAVLHIVDVYALVEFRCNNFENASVKSACPDV